MTASTTEKKLRVLWVGLSVLYGGCRVLLADTFLADYGLRTLVFAVIELTSAVGYGWASGALVVAFLSPQRQHMRKLLVATLVSYLASDAYVLGFANRMPTRVLVGVFVWTFCGVVVAIFGLRGRLATTFVS